MNTYLALRPLLFCASPETAHNAAIWALGYPFWLSRHTPPSILATRVFGMTFPSPIGLAAGFDKNAHALKGVEKCGFGFAEVGTLTPKPQAGNAKPRIFRLAEHEAIINRLGFNNSGAVAALTNLIKRPPNFIVGGNIGKNKDSTDAVADYLSCLRTIYEHVDYITINISSPNTPGLRALQHVDILRDLLQALQNERQMLIDAGHPSKPILVKLAPDLSMNELEAIAELAIQQNTDGLILTNTTLERDVVQQSRYADEQGGLSGKPLMAKSTTILSNMYKLIGNRMPLIGVGGVSSAHDAYTKILAGASLVQLYSAMVYHGPGLLGDINEGLVALLERDGLKSVEDAIGKAC